MGRKPSLSSHETPLVEPYNTTISQNSRSSEIAADPIVHHCSHHAPNSRHRHRGPELEPALRDKISSEWEDHFAWNRERRALHDHQQKDSHVARLVEKIDNSVEDQIGDRHFSRSLTTSLSSSPLIAAGLNRDRGRSTYSYKLTLNFPSFIQYDQRPELFSSSRRARGTEAQRFQPHSESQSEPSYVDIGWD